MPVYVVVNSQYFGGTEYVRIFGDLREAEAYADKPVAILRRRGNIRLGTMLFAYSAPGGSTCLVQAYRPSYLVPVEKPWDDPKCPFYLVTTEDAYGGARAIRVFADKQAAQEYRVDVSAAYGDCEVNVDCFTAFGEAATHSVPWSAA